MKTISEKPRSHYDKTYFDWQRRIGEFASDANLFLFKDYIKPADNVIDFGCGGGYLLGKLACHGKIGIDINESVKEAAFQNGIKLVSTADAIDNDWADVVISDNALEHTLNPYEELRRLYPKVKIGGRLVFVVPHEIKNNYKPHDINQHLYTWSPMCAGNLFTAAGYKVEKVETVKHLWPPVGYFQIRKFFGPVLFDMICRLNARLSGNWYQVRIIAEK